MALDALRRLGKGLRRQDKTQEKEKHEARHIHLTNFHFPPRRKGFKPFSGSLSKKYFNIRHE